jgi:hypothetical protein
MAQERQPIVILLAWFCIALAAGVGGWVQHFSAVGVATTVWTLTALVLLVCWRVSIVRAWAMNLDLKWLIGLHVTRFVGVYFLILASRGELPSGFARPAGIGDIAVAALALLLIAAATLRGLRTLVLAWNAFGLLDILFVISSALRFGLRDVESMLALRVLPLSLLPTFFVPLIIVSHVLIFVRMRKHQ